ncbi:MAG TPA: hypothetical protein VF252_02610 [Gemmatimonadales bacterium]
MRPSVALLLLALLSTVGGAAHAQSSPTPACADSLAKTMAFLQGHWQGRSYSVSGRDTVLDALMKVHSQSLFGRCAFEEHWQAVKDDQVLFTAKVIRAYDAPTQRWMVHYVDDQLNSQVYEGRPDAAEWRFLRTRLDRGVPIQVRLTWRPRGAGYEQLIERSRDSGVSWTLGGFVTFQPDPNVRSR